MVDELADAVQILGAIGVVWAFVGVVAMLITLYRMTRA